MSCGECGIQAHECRCDGGQPKNFLRPCLLLLLAEGPAHGYDLLERLGDFGFSRDPGGLYRALRTLEREGLVLSRWEVSDSGPDRCRYQVTPMGREWLVAWARTLDETRRILGRFLVRFGDVITADSPAAASRPVLPGAGPPFAVDASQLFEDLSNHRRRP